MNLRSLIQVADATGGELVGPDANWRGVSIDSRTLVADNLFVALRGPNFDGHDYVADAHAAGAAGAVVVHPVEVPLPQILVSDTHQALGRLAARWRAGFHGPLIALTGSNGKTTVKEMLRAILAEGGSTLATQGNLNNDIGVPKTLLRIAPEHRFAVVELGANHVGEIAYTSRLSRPDVAVIVNAGSAHLAEFGSTERIREAKGEILQGLDADGIAVLNRDDPAFDQWSAAAPGRVISFGTEGEPDVLAQCVEAEAERTLVQLRGPDFQHTVTLPLAGRHNVSNLAAAVAVMVALKLPDHLWLDAMERIRAVPGRLAQHAVKGWRLIDDAYNANPESVRAAIDVLSTAPAPQILVLGELGELGSHTEAAMQALGEYARRRIARLWTVGASAERAALAFGDGGRHFVNRAEVISALSELVSREKGGSVLVKGSRSAAMEAVMAALIERIEKGGTR